LFEKRKGACRSGRIVEFVSCLAFSKGGKGILGCRRKEVFLTFPFQGKRKLIDPLLWALPQKASVLPFWCGGGGGKKREGEREVAGPLRRGRGGFSSAYWERGEKKKGGELLVS